MENIKITRENVLSIQSQIYGNNPLAKNYEDLDFMLSAVNMSNYVLGKMKARGFLGYQHFVNEKLSSAPNKDVASIAFIDGTVSECISILLNYITPNPYVS